MSAIREKATWSEFAPVMIHVALGWECQRSGEQEGNGAQCGKHVVLLRVSQLEYSES